MSVVSRRDLLVGAGAAALLAGCRTRSKDVLRLGFMTNLTHAPIMAGIASGRIEKALGVAVEARSFRAGPRVLEALMGDAIDVGAAGPSAIVYTNARHGAGTLRLVTGCCSGGASFVVAAASRIAGWEDLRGKTLATTQIGTTQDISLRKYLHQHGYAPGERGGDVAVTALDAATILTEMRRGALDGAWLAEPWATRLVRDVGAVRLVDERSLWPDRLFPTALVVARGAYGREHPERMARLAEAVGEEVDRAQRLPDETRALVGDELTRLLGKRLPDALLAEAWRYVDFTRDPLLRALDVIADDAATLGLAPPSSHATLTG
ncbi:MAG TPA: ABC transporter substrate-binding protein [Polyangiaceae bacterium]|jgi:NitT/TauT family transport system substrate-binding protein